MQNRRRIFLIDKDAQGRIARHLVMMWIVGGLLILAFPVTINILFAFFVDSIPPQRLFQNIVQSLWFPSLTALLVIPIGVRHSIRFSNRLAGPMYRFKLEARKLLDGKPSSPINLRRGDFFIDFAEDFNRLGEKLQKLEAQHQSQSENLKGGDEQVPIPVCGDDSVIQENALPTNAPG